MTQPLTTPSSMEALIAETIRDVVEQYCLYDVPEDDASRADFVIVGKPTDELEANVVLSVHTQHPFGPVMDKDIEITGLKAGLSQRNFFMPMETMGGARSKLIVGCVQLNIRDEVPYDEAMWVNAAVAERTEKGINQDSSLASLTDDHGNTMHRIETFEAVGYQSGGSDVSVHHRWINWRAYIFFTNCRS